MQDMQSFVRRDQEIMASAVNHRKHLFSLLKPYLYGNVLEVGAGIGNITKMALSHPSVSSLTCIEPDVECASLLNALDAEIPFDVIIGHFPEKLPDREFDCIWYFNVLEHIENDISALSASYSLLKPGGYLVLFLPAFQMLFGSMDRLLGHFRRYNKKDISKKLQKTGFSVIVNRYSNFIGFFGWFINNRILKIGSQRRFQVFLFDRLILPLQSILERLFEPPFGQSLFVVAKK
jgi:SAM-dependent methyltransferase